METLLPIYQVLYFLIHFIYSLVICFIDTIFLVVTIFNFMCRKLRIKKHDSSLCHKSPNHIALTFLPDQDKALASIASAVDAMAKQRVKYFTLYDSEGFLLRHKDEMQKYFDENFPQRKVAVVSSEGSNSAVMAASVLQKCEVVQRCSKSCLEWYDVVVNLVSLESSYRQVLEGVQSLSCEDKHSSVKDLLHLLSVRCHCQSIPDPDLMLIIGKYLCSFGYPPWLLRLTEFTQCSSLDSLENNDLSIILGNYSKKEQRYGR